MPTEGSAIKRTIAVIALLFGIPLVVGWYWLRRRARRFTERATEIDVQEVRHER